MDLVFLIFDCELKKFCRLFRVTHRYICFTYRPLPSNVTTALLRFCYLVAKKSVPSVANGTEPYALSGKEYFIPTSCVAVPVLLAALRVYVE